MKKVTLMLFSVLICCLNVSANEIDDVNACETLSNDEQICSINKDGECECKDVSVDLLIIDRNDDGD